MIQMNLSTNRNRLTDLGYGYQRANGWGEFPGGLEVKDLALSLLWCRLHPWLRNFHIPWAQTKKKKKKKKTSGVSESQDWTQVSGTPWANHLTAAFLGSIDTVITKCLLVWGP